MKAMNRLQYFDSSINTDVLCRWVSQRSLLLNASGLLTTSLLLCSTWRKENNSKGRGKRVPWNSVLPTFFSVCIHINNKETSSKVLTRCAATEQSLAQSCHRFWSILSSYCQSSNNSHHLPLCLSGHLANVCWIDGFFQTPLWASLDTIHQTMEHNFIWKGYLLSNFYSESRSCFHLPSARCFTGGEEGVK